MLEKITDFRAEDAHTPKPKTAAEPKGYLDPKEYLKKTMRDVRNGQLTTADLNSLVADMTAGTLRGRGKFFFHADLRDFESAMYFDEELKVLRRIRSDEFLAWLTEFMQVNPATTTFKYTAAKIDAVSLSPEFSTPILPESYWAARDRAIYLSNGPSHIVKISAEGVSVVDNGTDNVLFPTGRTLEPWKLVEPVDPFLCAVFRDASCSAPHGLDLIRLWTCSLPNYLECKPPLVLAGAIGSGKTKVAKAIAELYGIPRTINTPDESGEKDFWVTINAGGLCTLDNCDTKIRWLADAVASAATGGTNERRRLYTDHENITLRSRSWLCLTSANPTFASDSGLADRILVVRMNQRTGETAEQALTDELLASRNAGLSYIAQVLRRALADMKPVPGMLNARHPDFARFAVRIGRAIGREAEAITALQVAEKDKSLFNIENHQLGNALLVILEEDGAFYGDAKELRDRLLEANPELYNGKLSPARLGKILTNLWPHLEKILFKAKKEAERSRKAVYAFKLGEGGEGRTSFP